MKNLIISLSLALLATNVFGQEKFTLKTESVDDSSLITSDFGLNNTGGVNGGADSANTARQNPDTSRTGRLGGVSGGAGGGDRPPTNRRINVENVREVIGVAKDIIALGKEIYELVIKGRPVNVGEFSPISVVPRDPMTKEALDPFELEMCSLPVEKTFVTTIQNGGREVVKFAYQVVFVYGCSYNGRGKFIQRAIIQPLTTKVAYGVEFSANLKLSGIMNHGTKDDPVVGAMLTLQYKMNTLSQAFEKNDTIYLSGKGEIKNYSF